MADVGRFPTVSENPKKRQKLGRKKEKARDERLSGHKMGPPCQCKRLKCFEITSEDERLSLLDRFNSLPSKNEQDAMLASLLTVEKVKQRRPRDNDGASKLHDHSYTYSVKVTREGNSTTVPVCFNAFISIFGTTKAVVERIRKSLAETGEAITKLSFEIRSRNKFLNSPHCNLQISCITLNGFLLRLRSNTRQ